MARKSNIIVHVPIFGRRSILERFIEKCSFDIYAAASTPADFDFCLQEPRIKDAIFAINDMDLKCQALLTYMRKIEPDAVLFLGCDDFLHPNFYQSLPRLLQNHDFIGFSNIYFHYKQATWLWPGYQSARRKGEPAGAGRVIRRDLLDKMDWKLWDGPFSEDAASWSQVKKHMENPLMLDCTNLGCTFVDVKDSKSATSIYQFDYLQRVHDDEHVKKII